MRLQRDVTPFAPNCSEGAPVNAKADPVALSLERLFRECPRPSYQLDRRSHEDGTVLHVRGPSGVACIWSDKEDSEMRRTDAQHDYWSRAGRP